MLGDTAWYLLKVVGGLVARKGQLVAVGGGRSEYDDCC